MCLGIPGQVVDFDAEGSEIATVEVGGVRRGVNVALLQEKLDPGDWVLIHVGFALAKIDEQEAAAALAFLAGVGQAYEDELRELVRTDSD